MTTKIERNVIGKFSYQTELQHSDVNMLLDYISGILVCVDDTLKYTQVFVFELSVQERRRGERLKKKNMILDRKLKSKEKLELGSNVNGISIERL